MPLTPCLLLFLETLNNDLFPVKETGIVDSDTHNANCPVVIVTLINQELKKKASIKKCHKKGENECYVSISHISPFVIVA